MFNIYKIEDGDTLESISKKYNIPINELMKLNSLEESEIRAKDELLIPDEQKKYFEYYTISKGDSIYAIAKKYNINPDLLSTLNGLNNADYIYPNQVLLIPKSNFSYYITKSGDTLDTVADTFGITKDKLLNDNDIVYLLEGQLLVNNNK